jgi:hypothetical protein
MNRYKSHKEVQAFKITDIRRQPDGDAFIMGDGQEKWTGDGWMNRHNPEVGGYFVLYEDGYRSYSPAGAFEQGYISVDDATEEAPPEKTIEEHNLSLKAAKEQLMETLDEKDEEGEYKTGRTLRNLIRAVVEAAEEVKDKALATHEADREEVRLELKGKCENVLANRSEDSPGIDDIPSIVDQAISAFKETDEYKDADEVQVMIVPIAV